MNKILTLSSIRRPSRWIVIGLALALVPLLLGGCFGPTAPTALSPATFNALGKEMVDIEHMPSAQLEKREGELKRALREADPKDNVSRAHTMYLLGYLAEYRETTKQADPDLRDYATAKNQYENAARLGNSYAMHAAYRLGALAMRGVVGASPGEAAKIAKTQLRMVIYAHGVPLWVRGEPGPASPNLAQQNSLAGEGGAAALVMKPGAATPNQSVVQPANDASVMASGQLDLLYRTEGGLDTLFYHVVNAIMGFFKSISPSYGVALALFFIAVVVKVITAPLTTAAYRGMRDMQRVQPLLKELQEKYKDDRQKQAEEQMRIMKEHKVNPAGGCLPMLIQLPIFIGVYQAVLVYTYEFNQAHFLWIGNLARPDIYLLILYALSMIVTQKLTTTPTEDPQQRMMQTQMTYMMPLFLVLVMQTIASAFLLYWFFLNILSSAHQYYLMQKFKREEAAAAPATVEGEIIPPADDKPHRRKKGS